MTPRSWVVMLPGSRWDDVAGTDRQLAGALGQLVDVLWVDPPFPASAALGTDPPRSTLHVVAPGVHRLQLLTVPGSSRPGFRRVSRIVVRHQIRREIERRGIHPLGSILLSPRMDFDDVPGGRRLLFVTDDWIAGAPLMGLDAPWVAAQLQQNLQSADVVAAVTPDLLASLETPPSTLRAVVPNGTVPLSGPLSLDRSPLVGLVGQLNERLDVTILEELVRRRLPLLVVGPLTAAGPAAARLGKLLRSESSSLDWVGPVSHTDLVHHLARMTVGITPYAQTAFNRASFPLKTLEYLGAGIPVVSTDLPAARALASVDLHVAADVQGFADEVEKLLAEEFESTGLQRRRAFAEQHSWHRRAVQVLDLLQPSER